MRPEHPRALIEETSRRLPVIRDLFESSKRPDMAAYVRAARIRADRLKGRVAARHADDRKGGTEDVHCAFAA
jgi:hypothetical protein